MLRKIRIATAVVFFILITLLFLDFTGTIHGWFGWMAKIQLVPAILSLCLGTLLFFTILTLLFGRLYCSVICPLGVFQDGISNISGRRKGKKSRFRFTPAKSWLRYGILALFLISMLAGISVVISMLDPYASFGRLTSNLLSPLYHGGNNVLAYLGERIGSYTFYSKEIWFKGIASFITAIITLTAIGILAWRNGRTYCNTICPVGTLLGLISGFSIFRPVINAKECTGCGACARNCKASCIDTKTKTIDYSRCVSCFNCIGKCKKSVLRYRFVKNYKKKAVDINYTAPVVTPDNDGISRRSALSLMAALTITGSLKAQQRKIDRGLAVVENKKIAAAKISILPPGALSASNMRNHCTGCLLCVSVCPANILQPSTGLSTFMQPAISYKRGYCLPECTKCSEVCPTGAIKPITKEKKATTVIGTAVWIKNNCIVNTDNTHCEICENICPRSAISLVAKDPENSNSLYIPFVIETLCIGCGACENSCPARPFRAIYVEGAMKHY